MFSLMHLRRVKKVIGSTVIDGSLELQHRLLLRILSERPLQLGAAASGDVGGQPQKRVWCHSLRLVRWRGIYIFHFFVLSLYYKITFRLWAPRSWVYQLMSRHCLTYYLHYLHSYLWSGRLTNSDYELVRSIETSDSDLLSRIAQNSTQGCLTLTSRTRRKPRFHVLRAGALLFSYITWVYRIRRWKALVCFWINLNLYLFSFCETLANMKIRHVIWLLLRVRARRICVSLITPKIRLGF